MNARGSTRVFSTSRIEMSEETSFQPGGSGAPSSISA
jgi:hypothetical protein